MVMSLVPLVSLYMIAQYLPDHINTSNSSSSRSGIRLLNTTTAATTTNNDNNNLNSEVITIMHDIQHQMKQQHEQIQNLHQQLTL